MSSKQLRVGRAKTDTTTVRWRDGVHINGTSIWCDAVRARDICFVSSGDALSRASHGQLIGTSTTLALLSRSREQGSSQLAPPLARPFTLGEHRIELFNAGSGLGSASLLISLGSRRIVYAATVNPSGTGLGGAADVRACDELIVSAHYGHARYAFADPTQVVAELVVFCNERAAAGAATVVLVRTTLKALDVAAALSNSGQRIRAHRGLHRASQLLSDIPGVVKMSRFERKLHPGEILLWPVRARHRLQREQFPAATSIAFVSGECHRDGAIEEVGADIGFAWSNEADHADLLRYIESSKAGRVYLLHRHGEEMAASLQLRGIEATALGPPRQLALF